jgi:hypothetical protein
MPTNRVEFKESLMRRVVRAVHREGMSVSYVEILPDRTIRVHTALRPPLDLSAEIESLGLNETLGQEAAA